MARGSATITDDFNRAGPGLGANWLSITTGGSTGEVQIDSSTRFAGAASGLDSVALWVGSPAIGSNDQWASVAGIGLAGVSPSYGVGAVARCSTDTDGGRDYYYFNCRRDGSGVLGKRVNGTDTVLFSGTPGHTATSNVEIECEGSTIRACLDGTPLGGSWTVTDTSLTTGGVGVLGRGDPAFSYGDSFQAGSMGAAVIEGTSSSTLAAATAAATGTVALAGTSSATLAALTSSAAGSVALAAALNATLAAASSVSAAQVLLDADMPAGQLGVLTSAATGTLAIAGTSSTSLAALSSSAAGALALTGTLAATLEAASLVATALGLVTRSGELAQELGALTAAVPGHVDIAAVLNVTLATLGISAAGLNAAAPATPSTRGQRLISIGQSSARPAQTSRERRAPTQRRH